jgi:hypothetical protein
MNTVQFFAFCFFISLLIVLFTEVQKLVNTLTKKPASKTKSTFVSVLDGPICPGKGKSPSFPQFGVKLSSPHSLKSSSTASSNDGSADDYCDDASQKSSTSASSVGGLAGSPQAEANDFATCDQVKNEQFNI